MGNLIFKGIQQVLASGFTQNAAENGVLYFVRNAKTGDADIYFGKKHYGSLNATQIATLQESIRQNAEDITAIETLLGDFKGQFTADIKTVAQVTKANADAISVLNGDAETAGSVAKAVADAKSELVNSASEGYDTLSGLETKIKAVESAAKTYEIKAITTGLGTNVKEAYGLFDEDGVQTGATINIYKDSSLKEVKLSGQSLQFTYILADGNESTVGVDVSAFLSESEFKNGLQVVGGEVSVKIDATSESFLSVDENGVKVSGIQNAINAATSGKAESSVVTALNDVVTAHTGDTDIHITASERNAWNAAEQNAKNYADDIRTNLVDDAAEGYNTLGKLEDKILAVAQSVVDKNVEAAGDTYISATVTGNKVTVGATTDLTSAINKANNAATKTDFNAHSGDTDIHITASERNAWNAKLDTTAHTAYTAATKTILDEIKDSLSSITNNAVTSVASTGSTILVSETKGAVNVEVNTLTHAENGQDGYIILNKTDEGKLYGVMYYGGDDVE